MNERGRPQDRGRRKSEALQEFEDYVRNAASFSGLDQAELVERFAERLGTSFAQGSGTMNRSQIRSFFDTVREIEYQSSDDPEAIRMQIAYLLAKTEYKRAQKHVSDDFRDFIRTCGGLVKGREDLERFVSFFEAVYAYHYAAAKR